MLTNHELVVAWQLLEAVCRVLLTRGGTPRKGLTAHRLQQFVSLYRGKLPFLFVITNDVMGEHMVDLMNFNKHMAMSSLLIM